MKKTSTQRAAEAHTNLCIFGTIQTICDGGNIYGLAAQQAAARIITICSAEQQRQLAAYDAAVADSETERVFAGDVRIVI